MTRINRLSLNSVAYFGSTGNCDENTRHYWSLKTLYCRKKRKVSKCLQTLVRSRNTTISELTAAIKRFTGAALSEGDTPTGEEEPELGERTSVPSVDYWVIRFTTPFIDNALAGLFS